MNYSVKARFGINTPLYIIAVLIIGAEITIIGDNIISSSRPIIRRWRYLISDISCHYSEQGDALPAAEDETFSPKPKSIFFHETSCRGGLTSRQACSVEAAARLHPQRQIYVLFSAPVTEYILKRSCIAKLLEFDNVKVARVHIAEYSKGSVLEQLLAELEESKYPLEHAADILRMLTLNKWGGIYLDTDMLVVKSLDTLPPNWVAKQSDRSIASGILAFANDEVGKNVTSTILKQIFEFYDPYEWSTNGPEAIQRAIQPMCISRNSSDNCNGVHIYPYELFYPLHYTLWKFYFKVGPVTNIEPPYAYHMWNFLSSYEKIRKGTPYDMLARKYCPSIYEMYEDEFGV